MASEFWPCTPSRLVRPRNNNQNAPAPLPKKKANINGAISPRARSVKWLFGGASRVLKSKRTSFRRKKKSPFHTFDLSNHAYFCWMEGYLEIVRDAFPRKLLLKRINVEVFDMIVHIIPVFQFLSLAVNLFFLLRRIYSPLPWIDNRIFPERTLTSKFFSSLYWNCRLNKWILTFVELFTSWIWFKDMRGHLRSLHYFDTEVILDRSFSSRKKEKVEHSGRYKMSVQRNYHFSLPCCILQGVMAGCDLYLVIPMIGYRNLLLPRF